MKLSTKKLRKIINESIKELILETKSDYSFKIIPGHAKNVMKYLVYLGVVPQTKNTLDAVGNFATYLHDKHKNILFESAETGELITVEQFLYEESKKGRNINPQSLQIMERDLVPKLFNEVLEEKERPKALKMYNEKIKNHTPKITNQLGKLTITKDLFLFLIAKG
tara:strand:+ start:769 stop:1266 length:498 start_codon:yes stop_codon:yes gene_type:complete